MHLLERRRVAEVFFRRPSSFFSCCLLAITIWFGGLISAFTVVAQERPNVLWIVAEDMSPDLGVYGNTLVETPNIDRLARQGVRFAHAFTTAPICSPARSALISGMYQPSLGAHNHRSQGDEGKARGHEDYFASYQVPSGIRLVPELFQEAGYYTVLGGFERWEESEGAELAKSDYNFIWDTSIYDGPDWSGRSPGQPFFAQVQLSGGKNRGAVVPNPIDPSDVVLPPYYPDHPVLREDWSNYLDAIQEMDRQVGQVLNRLEEEGMAENTVVFFLSDHGISHMRGKQFLYDEGIRVPLIVRWPGHLIPNSVRDDLVQLIDVAATSLGIAGIPVPDYMQGRDFFDPSYEPRDYVFAARDRADETVDIIRAVRGPRYKYIRNYYSDRPHAQFNQYKDGKEIVQTMRSLHADGTLNELQDRVFNATRPPEELYDLWLDPFEINNLADLPEYQNLLDQMRQVHVAQMKETRDMGLIPEPILEELGRRYGSKYAAMQQIDHAGLVDRIRQVIESGERGTSSVPALTRLLSADEPSVRYWAARELSRMGEAARPAHDALVSALSDSSAAVRVSAARALGVTGYSEPIVSVLIDELDNNNWIAGMYALLALEDFQFAANPDVLKAIETTAEAPYEFTRRVARRILRDFAHGSE